ncbi:hypothetical protein Hamer_G000720, partial [Homarus americanus]
MIRCDYHYLKELVGLYTLASLKPFPPDESSQVKSSHVASCHVKSQMGFGSSSCVNDAESTIKQLIQRENIRPSSSKSVWVLSPD